MKSTRGLINQPIVVLDIETGVCEASYQASGNRLRSPINHTCLNEVRSLAVLACVPEPDGWCYELESRDLSEKDNLAFLGAFLGRWPAASLVTYNGFKHDLKVVQIRSMRHALFSPSLAELHARRHVDVLHLSGGNQSLTSLIAALNLGRINRSHSPRTAISAIRQKCEYDVVATYLCMMHFISFREGCPGTLFAAWRSLTNHFLKVHCGGAHLSHLLRPASGMTCFEPD